MSQGITYTPKWVRRLLIPFLNLSAAFAVSSLVIMMIGEDPINAFAVMIKGAFGSFEGLGYTLYYSTNLIFTGLAVAIALHCGLFNIGGEGQAYIGGLGIGLVCLMFDGLPWPVVFLLTMITGALFGAAWGFLPGYLQAKRGSHIVITTIMFNFIASSLMVYLLVNVLMNPGQMSPETRSFAPESMLPKIHEILSVFGITVSPSPLNLSFLWALICCVLVWFFIWRTKWGYAMRAVGKNPRAAEYAGISSSKYIVLAMVLSGAIAGFVGLNELTGVQHRLILNFQAGYGFTGIAVALMARNHPFSIIFSALLFGSLYQGGAELSFEVQRVTPEIVVVIQGLIILFSGALENLFKPHVEAFFAKKVSMGSTQLNGGTA